MSKLKGQTAFKPGDLAMPNERYCGSKLKSDVGLVLSDVETWYTPETGEEFEIPPYYKVLFGDKIILMWASHLKGAIE